MSEEKKPDHAAEPAIDAGGPLTFAEMRELAAACCDHEDVAVEAWHGRQVRLKKLGAVQGIELGRMLAGLPADEEGQPKHDGDLVAFYGRLLRLSIVGPDGAKQFDSAEGERFLCELPFEVLNALGPAALTLNGMDKEHAKKK